MILTNVLWFETTATMSTAVAQDFATPDRRSPPESILDEKNFICRKMCLLYTFNVRIRLILIFDTLIMIGIGKGEFISTCQRLVVIECLTTLELFITS